MIILGVLVLLAVLATTFLTMAVTEKSVSHNFSDEVRAKHMAQSGIEFAISKIKANPSSKSVMYWGDNMPENGAPTTASIEWCKNPSFAEETDFNTTTGEGDAENVSVNPRQINVFNPTTNAVQQIGISGHSPGSYGTYCDVYTLKVTDLSGRIYVNDGLYMNGGNNSTVSQNLKRILNRMGKLPSVNVANLGDLVINNRPSTGYSNKFELIKAIGSVVFKKVEPFITTYGWVDKNVVNPVPIGFSVEGQYPVQYWRQAASGFPSSQAPVYGNKTFRRELGTYGTGSYLMSNGAPAWLQAPMQWYNPGNTWQGHNSIYTLDELFPQYVEVVWRAPVNVNAAPREVIQALVAGVQGVFWVERRQPTPHYPSPASFNYSGPGFMGSPVSFTEPQNHYTWQFLGMTMDSQGTGGDEYGHLYKTVDILMPGETGVGGLAADTIANHFIACRSKSTAGTVNYNGKWYSGMFRNWAQFNAFCDSMVENGVLADTRGQGNSSWYWDYTGAGSSLPGMTKPYSAGQAKRASYAIADTLKANFNPNCHLNETNPDANLFTLVDKTDLVANSTEFCFWPTGYFEVESLGRILRPTESTGGTGTAVDVFSSQQLRIVAEKKILVIMKMFDLYRETSQRHFQHGQVYPKMSGTETNSNRGMEVGPEVNNGPFPYGDTFNGYSYSTYSGKDGFAQYPTASTQINSGWNMEYDGYIQLTTIGGCNIDMPARPGTGIPGGQASGTMQTPAGSPHFLANQLGSYEGMHSHFQFDFRNHYNRSAQTHGDSFRDDLGAVVRAANSYIDQSQYSKPPKIERAANFPDSPSDGFAGPYCTAYSPNFRIARGFRLPLQFAAGGTEPIPMPYLRPIAPSDLRIDGAYSEFRSGLAYWVDEGYAINSWGYVASFWFKPSFYPEHAGRMRKIIGYGKWHAKNYSWKNPHGHDYYFGPAHFSSTYSVEPYESYASQYQGSPSSYGNDAPPEVGGGKGFGWTRPASLWGMADGHCYDGAGLADWNDEGPWVEYENYINTPPLNHNLHPNGPDTLTKYRSASSAGEKANYLEGNRWTHIMCSYFCGQHGTSFGYSNVNWFKVLVNGQELADTRSNAYGHYCHAGSIFTSGYKTPVFSISSFSDGATGKWRGNTFRLGDMCYHGFTANFSQFGSNTQLWAKNLTADGTFDEFFIWRSGQMGDPGGRANDVNYILNNGKQQWQFGRYYKPLNYSGSFPTDAVFESGKIFLTAVSQPVRSLPPLSNVLPPNGETGTTTTISFTASAKKIRILGVAWTSLEEDYARDTGKPIMYDWYSTPAFDSTQGKFVGTKMIQQDASGKGIPCSRLWVQIYDATGAKKLLFPKVTNQYGAPNTGFIDDYYSKLYNDATSQWYYELNTGETFTYVVGLKIEGLQNSTVLRATPVFDDVTFFYSQGDLEILMYIPINITG